MFPTGTNFATWKYCELILKYKPGPATPPAGHRPVRLLREKSSGQRKVYGHHKRGRKNSNFCAVSGTPWLNEAWKTRVFRLRATFLRTYIKINGTHGQNGHRGNTRKISSIRKWRRPINHHEIFASSRRVGNYEKCFAKSREGYSLFQRHIFPQLYFITFPRYILKRSHVNVITDVNSPPRLIYITSLGRQYR